MATTVGHAQILIGPELNNALLRRFEATLKAHMERIERTVRPEISIDLDKAGYEAKLRAIVSREQEQRINLALDNIEYRKKLRALTAQQQDQKINADLQASDYRKHLRALLMAPAQQDIDAELTGEAAYRARLRLLTRPINQRVHVEVDRNQLAMLTNSLTAARGRVQQLRSAFVALRPILLATAAGVMALLTQIINLSGSIFQASGAILGVLVPAVFGAVGAFAALALGFRGVISGSKLLTAEAAAVHASLQSWVKIGDQLAITFQKRAMPGVLNFLNAAKSLVPEVDAFFRRFGNTVNRVANDLAHFVKSPVFQSQFRTILEGNNRALDSFGRVSVNAFRMFTSIAAGAVAQLERFASWLSTVSERMADWLEQREQTGQLAKDFERMGDAAAQWGRIFGNVLRAIYHTLRAISPVTEATADGLERITQRWADWSASDEGQKRILAFFQGLQKIPWGSIAQGIFAVVTAMAAINAMRSVLSLASIFAPLAGLGPAGIAAGIALGALTVTIVGLTAAFAGLYIKNAEFRSLVNDTALAVGEELQPVLDSLREWFENDIMPTVMTGSEAALRALADGARDIGKAWRDNEQEMELFLKFLNLLLQFAFAYLIVEINYLTGALTGFIKVVGFAGRAFEGMMTIWNIVGPALSASWRALLALGNLVWNGIRNVIVSAWSRISSVFSSMRNAMASVLTPAFNALRSAVTVAWNGIRTAIGNSWSWVDRNVISKIRSLPSSLGNALSGLRDAIAGPFKAAFNGIAQAWNNTVGKLSWTVPGWVPGIGGNKISVPKIPTYAMGGFVQGPGTGTSDSIMAMLSNGEFIMRANAVKQYGSDVLSAMNQGLVNPAQLQDVAGFATGGQVGPTVEMPAGSGMGSLAIDPSQLAGLLQQLPGFQGFSSVLGKVIDSTQQLGGELLQTGSVLQTIDSQLLNTAGVIQGAWSTVDTVGMTASMQYQMHLMNMTNALTMFTTTSLMQWQLWQQAMGFGFSEFTNAVTLQWQTWHTNMLLSQTTFIAATTLAWQTWFINSRTAFNAFATAQQVRWELMWTQHRQSWDRFRPTVQSVIPNAFTAFKNRSIALFQQTATGIRNEWDRIRGYTKEPVRFVVNTVYNAALGSLFSAAKKMFSGMPSFASASLPSGFARGGVYPGYTPGRDIGYAAVSGGEAIMRPEFTRAVGEKTIHRWNAIARNEGTSGIQRKFYGPFFTGGIVSDIESKAAAARGAKADPGFFLENNAVESLGNALERGIDSILPDNDVRHMPRRTGVSLWDMFLERIVAMDIPLGEAGDGGDQGTGSSKLLQAMAGFVRKVAPGMRVSSGYRPGDSGYHGRQRAIDMIFSDGSQNRSAGQRPGGQAARAAEAITKTFMARTLELIWDPLGGRAIWNGRFHRMTGGGAGPGTHNDHIHWAFGGGVEELAKAAAGGGGSWTDPASELYKAAAFGTLPKATGLLKKAQEASKKAREMAMSAGLVSGDGSLMQIAYRQAKSMGASNKVLLALFMAGFVESGFRNLNYGDRDSVGFLQQRPSAGWGSVSQIMNPAFATRSFVQRAMRIERQRPGIGAGALAQAVQISAFPGRYEQMRSKAIAALRRLDPGIRFDTGGVLSPGVTSAANQTGSPEAVLTNRQWAAMFALAGSTSEPQPVVIENHHYIDGQEIDVRTDARIAAHDRELVRVIQTKRKR